MPWRANANDLLTQGDRVVLHAGTPPEVSEDHHLNPHGARCCDPWRVSRAKQFRPDSDGDKMSFHPVCSSFNRSFRFYKLIGIDVTSQLVVPRVQRVRASQRSHAELVDIGNKFRKIPY